MEPDAVAKTPAPYGQACSNCVKAKCRCMIRDGGGICDRCVTAFLTNALSLEQSYPGTSYKEKAEHPGAYIGVRSPHLHLFMLM